MLRGQEQPDEHQGPSRQRGDAGPVEFLITAADGRVDTGDELNRIDDDGDEISRPQFVIRNRAGGGDQRGRRNDEAEQKQNRHENPAGRRNQDQRRADQMTFFGPIAGDESRGNVFWKRIGQSEAEQSGP